MVKEISVPLGMPGRLILVASKNFRAIPKTVTLACEEDAQCLLYVLRIVWSSDRLRHCRLRDEIESHSGDFSDLSQMVVVSSSKKGNTCQHLQ